MRRSEPACLRPFAATALLLAALVALPAESAGLALRSLRIESTPPGAEVVLIGGTAGRTPLSVGERDIYPNDYPDTRAHLYGTVTLRHDGCETLVHRVTLDDIERGLIVALKCKDSAGAAATAGRAANPVPARPVDAQSPAPDAAARRLRQLQVLQELLDDGLLSPAEEQRIRRRLLDGPSP
jgi:hypothetical protein